MKDNQGLTISTNSASAAASFNNAVTEFLDYRLTAMPTLKQAVEQDPDFCMAHCLRGYMFMMFNTNTVLNSAKNAMAEAKRSMANATDREQKHLKALEYWSRGEIRNVCAQWELILIDYPLDILALRFHHFMSFWTGRTTQLANAPASVLDNWKPGIPNRGNVLGMLAFGLEENGHYREAERFGREAVELNPDDLWAIHAVAHVLEMTRRHKDGLIWLDYPKDRWSDRNPFRGHVWWHRGLFLIEAKKLDDAMELYDHVIYDTQSEYFLDIQNAAAFLSRLEFAGVDVGDRWKVLGDHAMKHLDDHVLPFTDINYVLTLVKNRRFADAKIYLESMRRSANSEATDAAGVLQRVAIPVSESLLALYEDRAEEALEGLIARKSTLIEVGASHAQRDLISLYTIEAARRANNQPALQHLMQERNFMVGLARAN